MSGGQTSGEGTGLDAHDAWRDQVGAYFDGELAAADEPAVLDHLADCARCQAELDDVVGIHVSAATAPGAARMAPARGVSVAQDRAALDAAAPGRAASDRAAPERAALDRLATDRAAPGRTASEHAALGLTASDRGVSDLVASEPVASDGAGLDREALDREALDRLATGRASPGRTASERAALGLTASDRAVSDRVASDRSASDRPATRPAPPSERVAPVIPVRRRRYALVGVTLAAAAVAVLAVWPREPARTSAPKLALAPTRVIEARFEAAAFAVHRPYAVVRGAAAREPIALDTLAALGRGSDPAALVAALASSGDVARAREVAATRPVTPSDRAALALLSGQAEDAFGLLDGHATTPAAQWNLALAARELGLPAVARRHFAEVVRQGEPGWRDEAARHVASLDGVQAVRVAARDLSARVRAMVAGTGPALTAADAAAFPALTRAALLDALRVAADRDAALALAPIADALDRATGTSHARAAVDRVAAASFAVRGRFRDRFRQLVVQALEPEKTAALLDELRRAGPDVADIRIGALIWSGQASARLAELAALVAPTQDPWLLLFVAREQLAAERATRGAASVVGRVLAAAAACPEAWAYRCARLAWDAAEALSEVGRDDEALGYAQRARALYASAGTPAMEDSALAYLGELARYRDRRVLARATFEEVELRAEGVDCASATYARIGRAKLALVDGRLGDARALLPAPDACQAPPDPIAVTIAVDVARESAIEADLTGAPPWLAAARATGAPVLATLATIGAARLAVAADPAATAPLVDWLAAHPPVDADSLAYRAWATGALIAAAGERADWPAVAEAARAEIAAPAEGCLVIASVDQDRQVVAARDAAGRWLGQARRLPISSLDASRFVPDAVTAALAGCPHVAVIARPPLHGSTALLPPALPWAFVSGPARPAARRAPRTVIVTDVAPPDPALRLSRLAPGAGFPADAVIIRDAAATPGRVLAELADATYVEINAHGLADVATTDASFLALSPEPSGRFMLTAGDVRAAKLDGPVVVLAACRSARLAPYLHRRWTLPDAFLTAGARAVIATDIDVPDAAAGAVFADLRARITGGEAPARALAAVRAAAIARDPASWVARIAVFE